MSFSQSEINDIVLKKIQTSPFTSTGNTITTESPGTSSYKIQQSNIYASPIPAIAPTVTLDGSIGGYEGGSRYIGVGDYNYIIKYDKVELKKTVDTSSWKSYYYKGTDTANVISTNILADAIPSNQDPGGTYGIVVWNGNNAYTGNFFFDTASGYVTFASSVSFTPTITFWRYEGNKGLNNIVGDLAVTGEVSAASFTATSDVRLKKEIKPLENSLEKICALQGVEFEFINDLIQRKNIGFIAQDIEKIIPQVVTTSEKGEQYKSVAYGNIVALLVEAIKELRSEIETLKNK